MRTFDPRTHPFLLLVAPAALLVGACDGASAPLDTDAVAKEAPAVPRAGQCDAVGRTVSIPLRMSSTRGHVQGDKQAVYKAIIGNSWYLARNHKDSTAGSCDDKRRHSAEVTIPVTIKCVPYVPQAGGAADATKPCQPEIDYGQPAFPGNSATRYVESDFSGTYHLGTRRVRVDFGSPIYETIEDYGNRTSSCFYHDGTSYTGAHWCITKADTTRSTAPLAPMDVDRGTRSFVVGLGAGFVHAHNNPNQWNVVLGGGWSGLSYGPASVGLQWNVNPPDRDESSGWLGYSYTVQCGTDGKPYVISRELVNASTGTTTLEYDWTAEQIAANKLCDGVVDRASRLLPMLDGHPDLVGEATLIRARARARDLDCSKGNDLLAGLVRNRAARDRVAERRRELAGRTDTQHVIAALDALDAWLRSRDGLYAPEAGLTERWRAVDAAFAQLDMLGRLVGLQTLYPAGELPAFDTAVVDLIAYLRGPGPIDGARVTTMYQTVQDRLADLIRNRLCRTRAIAALEWDQRRLLEDVENKEPYAQKVKDRITAARTALGVRTLTCDGVKTATESLQADLSKIFLHARGEKRTTLMRDLAVTTCPAGNRADFRAACDALVTRMRAIEFADKAALDAAYEELMATRKRLCEPPPPRIPPEQELPPVLIPPLPGVPPSIDDLSVEALDDLVAVDDLGPIDEADVALAAMLDPELLWDEAGAVADAAWMGQDAPWFDDGWAIAMNDAELFAPEPSWSDTTPDAPLVGEVCDLHHEPAPWPTDDPCEGCVTCTESGCSLTSGEPATCTSAPEPIVETRVDVDVSLEPVFPE
ncbi:MAG TPA: hypothetical protein VM261_11750 [Kofleriaceae bacterium]|nr:hypothetical protein [Kofleriaceae bacterium]